MEEEKELNPNKEIAGVSISLIQERLNQGYSLEEAFTSLRRTQVEDIAGK